jgi:tripartite-type tricarboxylate transporter receptor subunit TctC
MAKRSNAAPDIPTIAEQGLEGFDVVSWYGVLAPAGTPKPVLEKLHAALIEFAASPDVKRTAVEHRHRACHAQFCRVWRDDQARHRALERGRAPG